MGGAKDAGKMNDERMAILARLQSTLGPRAARERAAEARMKALRPNLVPARGQLRGEAARAQFIRLLRENLASVSEVAKAEDAPPRIADYLASISAQGPLRLAGNPWLAALPWGRADLQPVTGQVRESDAVGVSVALCGIAETGTLMLASGPDAPSGLNFLPPVHIVLLRAEDITGSLEDGWTRLRLSTNGRTPRTVNLISGPSRTADIAQTMYMGAHGPKHLHVMVVADDG